MQFWSKGLGRRTISLRLRDGEAVKSGEHLYVKGRTEEPVSWDYVMPMAGDDFREFVALLRNPAIAEFMYRSPRRWRLYAKLAVGGIRFLGLVLIEGIRGRFGPVPPPEPVIIIPPPSDREARKASPRQPGTRRRLEPRTG